MLIVIAVLAIVVSSSAVREPYEAAQVIGGGTPAVSPDGAHIAFISDRDGTEQVYVIDSGGSGMLRLTSTPGPKTPPAWSADGRRVLFSANATDSARLFSVNLDGSALRQVAAVAGRSPILSRDEREVLFTSGSFTRSTLSISDVSGAHRRAISDSSAGIFNQAFSPDGRRVAYSRLDQSRAMQVWVVSADGGNPHASTKFEESDGRAQWPAWSPDGIHIAIQADVVNHQQPELSTSCIWIIDVSTGASQRLAQHTHPYLDEAPSWFPDGKRIAFQSNRSGRMEVWAMNSDGTEAKQITR